MTLEEFEQKYAERTGVTVEWLHSRHMGGKPCNCDYEHCEGWQMGFDLDWYTQQRSHTE